MEVKEVVGKNVKLLRLQHRLTLKQLASLTNLTSGYLSLLERGLTSASLDTLEQIANCMDTDVSALFIDETAHKIPIIIRGYDYLFKKLDSQRFETRLTHFELFISIPKIRSIARPTPVSAKTSA